MYQDVLVNCSFLVTDIVFQPYTGTKNRKAGVSFARIKRHIKFANRSACYSGSDKDNAVLTHEVNVRRLWLQYMHDASCTFIYQGYILGRILYIYLIYFISNWSDKVLLNVLCRHSGRLSSDASCCVCGILDLEPCNQLIQCSKCYIKVSHPKSAISKYFTLLHTCALVLLHIYRDLYFM